MLTVRAMSGMSHPIPAHLVLMSRRQVLEEKDENFANVTGKDSTQLPRQPKHAPFPRVCCHHWAFQSKTRQSREAQVTQPSPLPRMPPSHLQCLQYCETFSVDDSCRRKLILAPSGGVGRCHRTVLTHVTELGWVRPMGEQHKCWARLIAGSKQFRFFSVILMKYFPATKLVWLMSCSTYEARNVHNSKHTHCCRCLSSKIITGEQRKSFQTIS